MIETFPKNLISVLDKLSFYNTLPIIVGGSVRDYFLHLPSKDYDIEVYQISSFEKLEHILHTLGKVDVVGKSFGILKLTIGGEVFDISMPRKENKSGIGHKGFTIEIDTSLSFTEASKRRDFTINALGYDYQNKTFLDPFGGKKDIQNKILRHIDEDSFCEDPLRVYRAMQFCARFKFTLDKQTYQLCQKIVATHEFEMISKERIFTEIKKLLLDSQTPSIGLDLLRKFNIYHFDDKILKMIDAMVVYKKNKPKEDLILMFYFLDEMVHKVIEDTAILKKLSQLKKFEIPKIYQAKMPNIENEAHLVAWKYECMENMPKPFVSGNDLILLGYQPSVKFGKVLDKLYQMQLDGVIQNKKEAKLKLDTLFQNN